MSFEEQIMSKDNIYRSIFSPQMDRGYYPSNLYRNAHSFENWGYSRRAGVGLKSARSLARSNYF